MTGLLARFRWLYAPRAVDLGFAVRTTIAALLALVLALWMEMDDPQWAPMTTWIVAQNSRGQSLSKARWRLLGTLGGAVVGVGLIAALPQASWLLFPVLAAWVGVCCGLATFLRNFHSYALVLMAFTSGLIALNAANAPQDVFAIALSRSTYIFLGILCESGLASIFAPRLADVARREIGRRVAAAIAQAGQALEGMLAGQEAGFLRSRALLGSVFSVSDQIEFSEVEMRHRTHAGDHARAALASVAVVMSRGLGLVARMHETALPPAFAAPLAMAQGLARRVRADMSAPDPVARIPALRGRIRAIGAECRQQLVNDIIAASMPDPQGGAATQRHLDGYVLNASLGVLLARLDAALAHLAATQGTGAHDHFRFSTPAWRDRTDAWHNGLRSAGAVLAGGLVWECTGWPDGATFAMFVVVTCSRFAANENPLRDSLGFLRGAVWAVVVAAFLTFVVLPGQAVWETLVLSLFVPMMVGGLALRDGRTVGTAAPYNNFLPFMVYPGNQSRLDELTFFNTNSAVVLGIWCSVLVFRLVLPFDPDAERWHMRRQMVADLRRIARAPTIPDTAAWVTTLTARFARLVRHAPLSDAQTNAYLDGVLATMTVGLDLIRLRRLLARRTLPPALHRAVGDLLAAFAAWRGQPPVTLARMAATVLAQARAQAGREANLSTRLEMGWCAAYLEILARELVAHARFFDTTHRFHVPSGPLPVRAHTQAA
ncbi:FUSC family protein [Komagataeibacter rhaeticus]|uniref:FUSC family protein n=1 Tax=Komagataeibacter rhaeticus TaxID=215221 RepID=UPI0004D80085|nr:FUSC family protein [Komagataeibacter rhaeticus]KDU96491.1 transporter [Komagataeibacter rhaeticus AF1]GBQ17053.1 fusaric acid resistance protein FusB [Komagataeibacter rhaeticus DSM 16663]